MNNALSIAGIILVLVVAIIGGIAQSQQARKGHGLCLAGKLTAPCDSWLMKNSPFKIKLTNGAKDKK